MQNYDRQNSQIKSLIREHTERGQSQSSLNLNGVHTINLEDAEAISELGCSDILLNTIAQLPPSVASCLSKSGANLHLNGLREISHDLARSFDRCGNLFLDGVTDIDAQAIQSVLNRKPALEIDFFDNIFGWQGRAPSMVEVFKTTHFNGLKKLDSLMAHAFISGTSSFCIDSVDSIDSTALCILLEPGIDIALNGIESMEGLVDAISTCRGSIELNGIPEVGNDVAKRISKMTGIIKLGGIKYLSNVAFSWLSSMDQRILTGNPTFKIEQNVPFDRKLTSVPVCSPMAAEWYILKSLRNSFDLAAGFERAFGSFSGAKLGGKLWYNVNETREMLFQLEAFMLPDDYFE